MLARYENLSGRDLSREKRKLFANALLGKTGNWPFLIDEIGPTGALLTNQRRLWPQVEFLKANLTVDDANRETAEQVANALCESYLAETRPSAHGGIASASKAVP